MHPVLPTIIEGCCLRGAAAILSVAYGLLPAKLLPAKVLPRAAASKTAASLQSIGLLPTF